MQQPDLLLFVLHIAGAASLLIWSVRLVRTGVERAFSLQLRHWLRRSSDSRLLAALSGTGSAILLQSSTAVALLVSNFVARGSIATFVGLAILLGADVGSAIVAQLLLVRQTFLVPLLLVAGVALFLRSRNGRTRQIGRILVGLALIFASLDMIRAAAEPLTGSPGTVAAMQYLATDPITAFAVGALFAWAVHSSVAAVLLFVTLVAQGLLPGTGALAMVLGANLGGAFIAYVLTLSAPVAARRMVVANLALRGGGAVLVLAVLARLDDPLGWLGADPARQVINLHLAFNLALALAAMPLLGPVARLTERLMPATPDRTPGGPARAAGRGRAARCGPGAGAGRARDPAHRGDHRGDAACRRSALRQMGRGGGAGHEGTARHRRRAPSDPQALPRAARAATGWTRTAAAVPTISPPSPPTWNPPPTRSRAPCPTSPDA